MILLYIKVYKLTLCVKNCHTVTVVWAQNKHIIMQIALLFATSPKKHYLCRLKLHIAEARKS